MPTLLVHRRPSTARGLFGSASPDWATLQAASGRSTFAAQTGRSALNAVNIVFICPKDITLLIGVPAPALSSCLESIKYGLRKPEKWPRQTDITGDLNSTLNIGERRVKTE